VILAVVLFALFGMGDGPATGGTPVSHLLSPALTVNAVALA
jgi:hypothetical protein